MANETPHFAAGTLTLENHRSSYAGYAVQSRFEVSASRLIGVNVISGGMREV